MICYHHTVPQLLWRNLELCQRVIIIIILCVPLCVGFIINLLTTLPVLLLDLNVEGKVRERQPHSHKNAKNRVFMIYMYSMFA